MSWGNLSDSINKGPNTVKAWGIDVYETYQQLRHQL